MDLFLITNCAPARHHYEKTKKQKKKLKNFFLFLLVVCMCVECVWPYFPLFYTLIYTIHTCQPHSQPFLYNNKCYIALILQKERLLLHFLLCNNKKKTNPKLGESEEITKWRYPDQTGSAHCNKKKEKRGNYRGCQKSEKIITMLRLKRNRPYNHRNWQTTDAKS